MVNYTTESKSKAINHDKYVSNVQETHKANCISCWGCIFSGKNDSLPILQGKLLCAKYITEIAFVEGAGTCDSAKSRFSWYNKLYAKLTPIKNKMLKETGFKFLGR